MNSNQMVEHKEALRVWLRGKGFHPSDIRYALTWFIEEAIRGVEVKDGDVLKKADDGHRASVDVVSPPDIVMAFRPKAFGWALLGGLIGGSIGSQWEGLLWLVLGMMQFLP